MPSFNRVRSRARRAGPVAAAALLLAVTLPACSQAARGGTPAADVLASDVLEIERDGGWEALGEGAVVPEGGRIRSAAGGSARLAVGSGEVWLGQEAMVELSAEGVELLAGSLVVDSGDAALNTRWTGATVRGNGIYRLEPGTRPTVRVFAGEVEVERPGEAQAVGALRELVLSSQPFDGTDAPLQYTPADAWDQALVGEAISFDDFAARIAAGIDEQFGAAPRDAHFYRSFLSVDDETLPVLARTATVVLAGAQRFGPPSDVLVTLFVARTAANARDRLLSDVAEEIAALRGEGASWGLVALTYGVRASAFATVVDLGVERSLVMLPDAVQTPTGEPSTEPPALPLPAPAAADADQAGG